MTLTPPEYFISRSCFLVAVLIVLGRLGWWLAFEYAGSKLSHVVLAFVMFGTIGFVWVFSMNWVNTRHKMVQKLPEQAKQSTAEEKAMEPAKNPPQPVQPPPTEKKLVVDKKLIPKMDVKLLPFPPDAPSPYKYPLKKLDLMIQNLNKDSVAIRDLRIEFVFNNIVTTVKSIPLGDSGGSVSVGGMSIYAKKQDGIVSTYEEKPVETSRTKNFSFVIQRATVNGKEINTNIIIFDCERWPEGMGFAADIVIDVSQRPEVMKTPDRLGTYSGIFYYEIKGKKFSQNINGTIPN